MKGLGDDRQVYGPAVYEALTMFQVLNASITTPF